MFYSVTIGGHSRVWPQEVAKDVTAGICGIINSATGESDSSAASRLLAAFYASFFRLCPHIKSYFQSIYAVVTKGPYELHSDVPILPIHPVLNQIR